MRNFTNIKTVLTLLILLIAVSFDGYSQQDSLQESAPDTSSVAITESIKKGYKIKGTLIDGDTNHPINGASVTVENYSATRTDEKGNFSITVPDYYSTIRFVNDGYHEKIVPAQKGQLKIKLFALGYSSLYAIASLPNGPKTLARTVSAISAQTSQDLWAANSENPTSNFQGRIAGANTLRRSGTPGIGGDVFIRGFNSLFSTNKPLYIVDGMIYDVNAFGMSLSSGYVNDPLSLIDVRDIASYTVIKDAAAAAVYGTRAANGVVFINTHRANQLATTIDFAVYGGVNFSPSVYPVMNANDFRGYITDIITSGGLSRLPGTGSDSEKLQSQPFINDIQTANPLYNTYFGNNTNWQDRVLKSSIDQNYYVRIKGGDNIAKYSLSLGYLKDNSLTDNTDFLRYNTRFNADLNLTQRLTGTASLSFSYSLQNLRDQGLSPNTNPIFSALVKSPFLISNVIAEDGAVSPNLADTDIFGTSNPSAIIANAQNREKTYRFFGSVDFAYRLGKAFKLSTLTGLTYDKQNESYFAPKLGVANEVINDIFLADSRSATQALRYFSVYNDTRLSFNKIVARHHKITSILGFRYSHSEAEQDFAKGFNNGTDQLISISNSNAAARIFGGGIGKWNVLNSYLTTDYSFADRYLFNASIAVDGSSRFGKSLRGGIGTGNDRFAVLPSIGAAWIISSENFMKDLRAVELLKLRMSYGLVGNDDIGNYTARRTYVSQNLLGVQGNAIGNIANPYLQWEVVRKFNTGIDAALWNERLSVSLDVWSNKTTKMLTSQSVNDVTVGVGSYLENNAAMKTTGLDVGLNVRVLNKKVLKWDAGFNLGAYKNEVTRLASGSIYNSFAGGTYITQVGQDANLFYGYKTNGVYSTSAEAAAAGLSVKKVNGELISFQAGDIRFENVDGSKNGVIDDADRVVIGNPNPDFFGSINNTVSYKRWKLDALFTFVVGNDIYNYTRAQLESGKNFYNQTNILLNRWRVEGQVTNTPRATYGDPMGNSRFSDRWIEDGSYLRLRTLSASYSLPIKNKSLKYANLYATANNLLTFSRYLGFDPEFSASGSIFTQGVDTTLEPQFKSVQLGIKVGL